MWNHSIKIIFFREIRNYFNTPIGYVFAVSCLFFNFLFFFFGLLGIIPVFFEAGKADIGSYFNLLPLTFILLVPAVTMRIWAEERKQGTIELLSTLPLPDRDMVLGKFYAAWAFVGGIVLAAIPLALTVWILGPLDWGGTAAMILGSLFMAGAYVSTGMVISALTREQIVAFIITFFISLLMFIGNYFIISRHLPLKTARVIGFFSHSYHYGSFSRGIIDLGDVIFFISFIVLMLTVNIWLLRRER